MLDENGYPCKATLKEIREWSIDHSALMKYIQNIWWMPSLCNGPCNNMSNSKTNIWYVSTGGWSGNEEIIEALKENTMFWMMCWISSFRGGHYTFEIKKIEHLEE